MKKEIHPVWYQNATITCSCGHTFTVGATVPSMRVPICNQCHPLYSGEEKLIDTEGLVEKYHKRQAAYETLKSQRGAKKQKKENQPKEEYQPRTLKEMLQLAKKQTQA